MPRAARRHPGRRALVRARHLACLRPLGARVARSRALRRRHGRDRSRRPLGARHRRGRLDRGDAARPGGERSGDSGRRRRRAADPARPVRRGRHGAGTARARRCPVRRRRRCGFGSLHGQGPVQEGAARQRASRRAPRRAPRGRSGRRTRSGSRASSSRRGSALRSGSRRPTTRASSPKRSLLAFRHDDKVLVEEFLDGIEVEVGVLGNREPIASIPGQIVPLGHEWYDYSSKYDEGGMDLVIPPDLPDRRARAGAAGRGRVVSRHGVRGDGPRRLLRRRRRPGRRQRVEHDSGLHLDERLREAVRRVRHSVRRVAAPPDRARPRAARAPREARVLALPEGAHFVDVREVAVRRELRDPDEVVALRRRLVDREPRRPSRRRASPRRAAPKCPGCSSRGSRR